MLIARLRRRGIREVARYALRLGALSLRRPTEAVDHITMQLALTRSAGPSTPIAAIPDWRRVLHEQMGASWPCEASSEFRRLWSDITPEPVASTIDHDADAMLAEMVWCVARHLRPRVVVETGVSRGMTSRVILEAFARNGDGHLWSIDLPPLDEPWRSLVGTAVPAKMREHWTYLRGSSRRRLPELCRHIGAIDLFIHDSLHTRENLRLELASVWPHLRAGAVVVIDDANECGAADVVRRFTPAPLLGASEERKRTSVGFTMKALKSDHDSGDSVQKRRARERLAQ